MRNKGKGAEVLALMSVLLGMVVAVVSVPSEAQWNLPTAQSDRALPPSEAPCIPFSIGASTPADTSIVVRNSGPGYVSWVKFSTSTYQDFVLLRDTGSVNFQTSVAHYYLTGGSATVNQSWDFTPPMRFSNGLLAAHNNAAVWVTGCTRLLGTQTP